jgi:hypothetical protein
VRRDCARRDGAHGHGGRGGHSSTWGPSAGNSCGESLSTSCSQRDRPRAPVGALSNELVHVGGEAWRMVAAWGVHVCGAEVRSAVCWWDSRPATAWMVSLMCSRRPRCRARAHNPRHQPLRGCAATSRAVRGASASHGPRPARELEGSGAPSGHRGVGSHHQHQRVIEMMGVDARGCWTSPVWREASRPVSQKA